MDNHIVDITGKNHNPDEVSNVGRKKELAMDLGSLHDNLASPVPFFIHCVYERSIDKKTTKPFKLSALDCLDIAALMKDKTDLTDKELLSFVKGVVDSNDLSLNVSREILQKDPNIDSMRSALTKRVLDMLDKIIG